MRRCAILILLPAVLTAQMLVDPNRQAPFNRLMDGSPNEEKPIPGCSATPLPPRLNFGFRFVTGYLGHVPFKSISGDGHRYAILTRVTPDDPEKKPVLLSQFFRLPKIPHKTNSELEMDGAFLVGEGGYKVEWLMADRDGNTCRKNWHIQAKPTSADRELAGAMPPGAVTPVRYERWNGVPLDRLVTAAPPKRLTVLLHVAPLSTRRLKLHPYDQALLLSSLLTLLERTPFTQVKLVAFNLDQQKEIFRQDNFDGDGWERLIDSILALNLLTVNVSTVNNPIGHRDTLRGLVEDELAAEQTPDAVVFLGPTTRQTEKLKFEPVSGTRAPAFYYLQFKPPWARGSEFPDIISHAVKRLMGKVYHIYTPHDFSSALQQVGKN